MKYDVLSLSGNIFVFENQQCDCLIDIAHDQRGAEQKSLRLKGTENIIRYAYMPKEGLVRVNPKTGSVESGNVLAELLAVRCDDLDSMLKFFTNNEFFIPISREVYEKYEIYEVSSIFRRIQYTVEILTLLQAQRKNYMDILSKVCWLIFMNPITLKSVNYNDPLFETCVHSIHNYLSSAANADEDNSVFQQTDPYDPNIGIYRIPDSVRPPYNDIGNIEYDMEMSEPEWDGMPGMPAPPSVWDYHSLMFMYKNFIDIPKNDRKVIEFFYHMRKAVGRLEKITLDGRLVFNSSDESVRKNIDDQLKNALLEVAKITVKEEIDYSLYGVTPSYDIESMTPSWTIPNLITGLFFSLFYLRPNMEAYRRCANISCNQYFLVNTTNSKRKYCCPECANAMAQRMLRKRKKEASSQE